MGSSSRQPASESAIPRPGLLIVTGASHTGKTSVIETILGKVGAPTAFLGVDDVLATTLINPVGDIWTEIPLAYELLRPQVETLLDRGWFVVFESTFTYVPDDGPAEFHGGSLRHLIEIAEQRQTPWLLTQLSATDGITRSRSRQSGRLAPEIVARTAKLHHEAKLPTPTLRLDSADLTPDGLAERILAASAEIADS